MHKEVQYRLSELPHFYGEGVHLIHDPYAQSLLSHLSSSECRFKELTSITKKLYERLLVYSMNHSFPKEVVKTSTRMISHHHEAILHTNAIKRDLKIVTVDIARAGMVPSQTVLEELSFYFNEENIRQDHLYAARATQDGVVTGVDISGSKIGGDIENAIVIFPDPMGATGKTLAEAISLYKTKVGGKALKFIALHLIVTPEYLKKIKTTHPDVEVFSFRLDRGLSKDHVLESELGKYWDEEIGLNKNQYIVPGAGGVGELLNNSFV